MPNNNSKRADLIQLFYETQNTMHRILGDNRGLAKPGSEKRRGQERRHPQTELLYLLSRNSEMTIKQIAAAMYISSSAATQMVESLVVQKVLERKDDTSDRRVVRVKMTPFGKKQFQKFKNTHLTRMEKLLKNLSNEELKGVINLRNQVIEKIELDRKK